MPTFLSNDDCSLFGIVYLELHGFFFQFLQTDLYNFQDLAARNVVVSGTLVCKVTDYSAYPEKLRWTVPVGRTQQRSATVNYTRSSDSLDLSIPYVQSSLVKRDFSVIGPGIWNKINTILHDSFKIVFYPEEVLYIITLQ